MKPLQLSLTAVDLRQGFAWVVGTLHPARRIVPFGRFLQRRPNRRPLNLGRVSFFWLVLVPTLCTAVYLTVVASKEYVSEARIVVRSGTPDPTANDPISAAASAMKGVGAIQSASQQDAYIVTNYIEGRSIIDHLGGPAAIFDLYSRSTVDWLSRLAPDANFEAVWKYWRSKVTATLDTPSGIIILQARAFEREEAEDLAKKILAASERLVNEMSDRARGDALGRAQAEFTKAKERVQATQQDLLYFRNNSQLLDPMLSAGSANDVLTGLIRDKLALENEIATTKGSVSASSPVQRIQQARLTSLNEQIDKLMASLTSQSSNKALSVQLAKYEELQLEVKFAERIYEISAAALERAHQEVERQQLYVFTVVKPTTPGQAAYPRPILDTLLVFVWATVLWSILALMIVGIRDHG